MKGITGLISHWIIPPGFQNVYRYLRLSFPMSNTYCQRNIQLKNIHSNERCFILATGPSIKKQDLTLLKNEICIAVSNFFVHPDYSVINPKYYCIAPFHSPITEDAWQKWLIELERKTKEEKIFFSLSDRVRNQQNQIFSDKEIYFLNFAGSWDNRPFDEIDLTRKIPQPQSVTIMALYVSIYMGFSEIYLIGCDHDWILHFGMSAHFYDENNHALVKNGYNEFEDVDLEKEFESNQNLWKQYKILKKVAEKNHITIFNATAGGLLDVFPRVRLDDIK